MTHSFTAQIRTIGRFHQTSAPQGLAGLAAYVRLMQQYPLVAIGGISADLFPAVRATGVGSVAVVRALVNAPDPEAAAAHLLERMKA